MISKTLFSSKSDEWKTPQDLFDKLDKEFTITLDPCATRENTKCHNWYGKDLDGLTQSWRGQNVFCNPPYSQISKWAEKAYNEARHGVTRVILLIPARTDTRWFHKYIYKQENVEIRFIKGRLKFSGSKNSAPFPSMIVIFN